MTHQNKRCAHCATTYAYQSSGGGCLEPTNDPTYCPSCKKVVLDALSSVPAKFERDWVVTRDVSVETLVELERERLDAVREKGGIPVRRVLMGLYDMADFSNHNHRGLVRLDGKTYSYDYWEKGGMAAGQVCVEVEREVATGKVTGPYDLRDYWRPWPTLFPDEERGAKLHRDPDVKVEVVPTPFPLRNLSMPITRLVEDNSLANLRDLPDLPPTRTYEAGGQKEFSNEPLPDGVLPIYDEE